MIDSNVSELLTGFASIRPSILTDLFEATKRIDQRTAAIESITTLMNEFLDLSRAMHKGLNSELRDGPGLFSLVPSDVNGWQKLVKLKRLMEAEYDLWLWCDHPDCLHPVKKYTIKESKEWLRTITPYVNLAVGFLKLGIPVTGAAFAAFKPHDFTSDVKRYLDLMQSFANSLKGALELHDLSGTEVSGMTKAQGAGVRALHALLKKVDPNED